MSLKDTDVKTPGDAAIAKKFKLSLAKVRQLVKAGAEHEKEHNTNQKKAEEVARDHIGERPDYYKMLNKAEKTDKDHMKEEIGTAGVRGFGNVTGDPAGTNFVQQYIDSNSMSYVDENGNKLGWIKKHTKGHNVLGFKEFNPTDLTKKTKLKESIGSDYGTAAVPVIGDLTGNTRRVAKVEEKNDLKGTCWKGYTAKGLKKKGGRMVPNCVPVSEQGSPANPARYTERPTYEMKAPDNKLSSGEVARGIYQEGWASIGGDYGPYNRFGDVDRKAKFYGSKPKPTTTKNDEKDDTYKGSKQGGKVKFAKSIKEMDTSGMRQSTNIDDRRGLVGSIKGAYKVFSDKAHRQGMTGTQAQGAAAIDTAKSVASTAAERLANNLNDRFAPKFPQSWSGSKPSTGLNAAEKEPISSPTGATPPSITAQPNTPKGNLDNQLDAGVSRTPRSDGLSGRTFTVNNQNQIDKEQIKKDIQSRTPSWSGNMNEISAELVGKVSNARWRRGETPSKTLTRAINKKFVTGGKDEPPFIGGHKRSHEKSSTHVHRLAVKGMKGVKEDIADKDWDDTTGKKLPENHNKPDTSYAPGATGKTKTIYEETKMDTKEHINEALDNILDNNLSEMKEHLLAALQEKAMEKLEEKKKDIAANYFAQ